MTRIDATVYNTETEEIVKTLKGFSERTVTLNLGNNESWAEGCYSGNQYYLKGGEFKPYPPKPTYPVTFDKVSEQWAVDIEAAWSSLRAERDYRLETQVDPIVSNPLRWSSMSQEEQGAYSAYRLELLSLPENTTDPINPAWPTKPT